MRTRVLVLVVGLTCLAGGFYAGWSAGQRARVADAQAALRRAQEAMTVGRRDEALQYAFAALDRDPGLYAAYEVAGDAIATQQYNELSRHYYRAVLVALGEGSGARHEGEGNSAAAERARIQAKIAALDRAP